MSKSGFSAPGPEQAREQALERGVKLHNAGQLQQAAEIYRDILCQDPNQPVALNLLGVIATQSGQLSKAIDLLRQAVAIEPSYSVAHCNLGNAYKQQMDLDKAVSAYQQALTAQPDYATAHFNLGLTYLTLLRDQDAQGCFENAVRCKPDYDKALTCLADLHKRQGRLESAVECYRRSLAHNPKQAGALVNLGVCLSERGQFEDAIDCYEKALKVDASLAEAHNNLGKALRECGRPKQALPCFRTALDLRPGYFSALNNMAIALRDLGRLDESITTQERALEVEPDNVIAKHNLSLALLTRGDYQRGWELFEHRWQDNPNARGWRNFPYPLWDGSNLGGKSILVWGEQGIGDEIVYASLYNALIDQGARCFFECNPRLVPVFERSFADAIVVPQTSPPNTVLDKANIDFQCPAASLMRWLLTSLDGGETRQGYLRAETDQVTKLKARYGASGSTKIVGLGWSTRNTSMSSRYDITLEQFDELLQTPDVQFVNLQYGDTHEARQSSHARTGVEIFDDPAIDPLTDMDLFAAQVASMDLVISIVNSTAVLASGLGVPVWGLVPNVSEWRWGNEGQNCRWFPSMPLYRQSTPGDWTSAMKKLIPAFQDWARRP